MNIDALKQFHEHTYARNLVLKTPNVEIILVCWRPGQASPMHSHGPSDGVIVVLEGELHNTNLTPDGRRITTIWHPGDIGHTPVGVQHEVINQSKADVVTLNIYAAPLLPEYHNPDLGYSNEVAVQELQLPNQVVQYVLGRLPESAMAPASYQI
ncbi:MAG: cupin domain-containing protein [Cyanobacteria bacterium]|nr:cupin domain-containing protein [Cyanobacteriota bacterium]